MSNTRISMLLFMFAGIFLAPVLYADAATLTVGPGKQYATPSAAITAASDGDLIEISAGTYTNDFSYIKKNNLTLRGVGGRPVLSATTLIGNGKAIWVLAGNNTTIENIEFTGARVSDNNGAGIRGEGGSFTIRNSYFHHNQDGILAFSSGNIVIENSEFAYNGHDDRTHNIYITSPTKSFTLRGSYSHHALIGHLVKTRAEKNVIEYNRLMDEVTGNSSYVIDISDGGETYITGNVIQQGSATENSGIISYAPESRSNPTQVLTVMNNTIVNDHSSGTHINVYGTPTTNIVSNLFVGPGTYSNVVLNGGNVMTNSPAFLDKAAYNYQLTTTSPAIDRGVGSGPAYVYIHPLAAGVRTTSGTAVDAGAYEYSGTPPPPAPSPFALGDRIKTNALVTVFSAFWHRAPSGTQPIGAHGTLQAGPKKVWWTTWWKVDYDTGFDGWTEERQLTK